MTSQPPKITVVIPVYNAQEFLERCLNSAINQTLSNIEIVCVDDCSTDDTPRILNDYATGDMRIRIHRHAQNKGEGAARNTGMAHATGDFIFHLDADDELPAQALFTLHSYATIYSSELVKGGFVRVFPPAANKPDTVEAPEKLVINTDLTQSAYLQGIPAQHCTYLYSRSLLEKHGIRYRTDLSVGLDLLALTESLVQASRVTLIPDVVYIYHQSGASATRGGISYRQPSDALKAKAAVHGLLKERGFDEAAAMALQRWNYFILNFLAQIPVNERREQLFPVFDEFNELIASRRISPLKFSTPNQYRYFISLVLARRYEDAAEFMDTREFTEGYADNSRLKIDLGFVLSRNPGDAGARLHMARIAQLEANDETALDILRPLVQQHPAQIGPRLQLITTLRQSKLLGEAVMHCLVAVEQLSAAEKGGKQLDMLLSTLRLMLFGNENEVD